MARGQARSSTRSQLLLHRLHRFFRAPERRRVLTDVLLDKSTSLRTLEYFVTKSTCHVGKDGKEGGSLNVPWLIPGTAETLHDLYAINLKAHGKQAFDPFCRGERVELQCAPGKTLSTTVGQLNFFRWVIKHDVLNLYKTFGSSPPRKERPVKAPRRPTMRKRVPGAPALRKAKATAA